MKRMIDEYKEKTFLFASSSYVGSAILAAFVMFIIKITNIFPTLNWKSIIIFEIILLLEILIFLYMRNKYKGKLELLIKDYRVIIGIFIAITYINYLVFKYNITYKRILDCNFLLFGYNFIIFR